ncbi:MAG TPA: cupredoxin domain-containing protein [Gaiellaceae bacterium]|nr:cupredoxin domain-containing protein [Gaiellaceae bacterium]
MRKLLPFLTAGLVLAVGAQSAAAAPSSLNISIKKGGFTPRTSTLAYGAKVTWTNNDKANHQIVANDGSFASPVLASGKSYTFTFTRSGKFNYHDALHTGLTGTLTVNGPPPSLTLGLDQPIVVFGTKVTLSGKAENVLPGTSVTLWAQEWNQPSPVQLAVVQTASDGSYGYTTLPHLYTTYTASFQTLTGNTVKSSSVFVQVTPKLTLATSPLKSYLHVQVNAGKPMTGRHVLLQRLSPYGQWVTVRALKLTSTSGVLFNPAKFLPKGMSRIRVTLSVNQAGIGLLGAISGTRTVHLVVR